MRTAHAPLQPHLPQLRIPVPSMRGHAVINGLHWTIRDIRLVNGQFHIHATRNGPVQPFTNMPATIFGEDGQGICQSWETTLTPTEAAANHITIILPIQINTMELIQP